MTILESAPAATTTRASTAAGFRELADILEHNEHVPLPVDGHLSPMTLFFGGEDPPADMTRAATVIGGIWEPKFGPGSHGVLYSLNGYVGGVRVQLCRYLDAIDTEEGEVA